MEESNITAAARSLNGESEGDSSSINNTELPPSSLSPPPSSPPPYSAVKSLLSALSSEHVSSDEDEMNSAKVLVDNKLSQKISKLAIAELGAFEFTSDRLKILPCNEQVRELQTILRDKTTSRNDFKFYADRLIRLVIEESLNQLPFTEDTVVTPTGRSYSGLKFEKGNCGVSIVRSGEVMEQGLRDCCRSMRIGKILIESDAETHEARAVYAKFPRDIASRKVLLMYPIMGTGNTVVKALKILKDHGVAESNVILSNLFATPTSVQKVLAQYPTTSILTSEIHAVAPSHFGQKYFGTD